jgi:hypothetical protein
MAQKPCFLHSSLLFWWSLIAACTHSSLLSSISFGTPSTTVVGVNWKIGDAGMLTELSRGADATFEFVIELWGSD